MIFVFLRPELCRLLPSDSTSRWTPLRLANGWLLHTPITDLHRQVICHARHTIQKAGSYLSQLFDSNNLYIKNNNYGTYY